VALIDAGLWRPAAPAPTSRRRRRRTPTFERFAHRWLQAKRNGNLGPTSGIAHKTADAYRWALGHLLPFFGHLPVSDITRELCLEFKALQLRQARDVRVALAAGVDLRDRSGRRAKPLSPSSIKKLIELLGTVLDEAVHDGFLPSNPARGRRLRIKMRRPTRSALEIDELAALLDAATALDHEARNALVSRDVSLTTRRVEQLLQRGRRPSQIAADLELARSTVSWHLRRLGVMPGQGYVARRVVCELLGRAGLRSSELCGLRIGDLRLDAPAGAHLRIRESKTEAGVREVQLSPALVDALRDHLERLRAARLPDGPDAFLVPSTKGTRLDTRRVRVFVAAARERANEVRAGYGLPPLPPITPHALRRTYVSIALLANGFDVKWVMGQVGHADSRMTLEVYAQLMRRARREHGVNFDRLVREARADAALLGAGGGASAVRRPRRRAPSASRSVCRACGRPHQRPRRRGRRGRR
jgi:integrase